MIRIRRGVARRLHGLRRNPRHFLQLLLPAGLVVVGWVALVFDWRRLSFLLVSAALIVFAGLLWMRLRRIQTRIDMVLKRTAALQSHALTMVKTSAPAPAQIDPEDTPLVAAVSDEALPPGQDSAVITLAMALGVPAGLFTAVESAAPRAGDETMLVVPKSRIAVVGAWARAVTGTRWRIVDESPDNGLQRSRAAGLDVVIIVDGDDEPDFTGVLDQSFFWWLPRSARLYVVSDDLTLFAARLSATHDVEFSLVESWPSAGRLVVTRAKEPSIKEDTR